MADILGKIGESLKSTLKEATQQTQKSVDQVAYRTDIITKKNELKKLYQMLGEMQYKAHEEGEESPEQNVLYTKISFLKKDIEEAENKINDLVQTQKESFDSYKEGVKTAWNDIVSDVVKTEDETDEEEDAEAVLKICPECHTGNHKHAAYCIRCGKKFE